MDTNSFIVHLKMEDICKDIAEDVEIGFDTSNFELDRPLSKRKKQKGNWINERWIMWINRERICGIKSKNI